MTTESREWWFHPTRRPLRVRTNRGRESLALPPCCFRSRRSASLQPAEAEQEGRLEAFFARRRKAGQAAGRAQAPVFTRDPGRLDGVFSATADRRSCRSAAECSVLNWRDCHRSRRGTADRSRRKSRATHRQRSAIAVERVERNEVHPTPYCGVVREVLVTVTTKSGVGVAVNVAGKKLLSPLYTAVKA